jgi:hypothetical protein
VRKIVSAIAALLVFISLQYGKVAEYLYCEVQAKVVLQQAADCGCDQYLIGMFGDDGSDGFTSSPLKEKPSDLFTACSIVLPTPVHTEFFSSHFNKQSDLLNQFPEPAFHPPA